MVTAHQAAGRGGGSRGSGRAQLIILSRSVEPACDTAPGGLFVVTAESHQQPRSLKDNDIV